MRGERTRPCWTGSIPAATRAPSGKTEMRQLLTVETINESRATRERSCQLARAAARFTPADTKSKAASCSWSGTRVVSFQLNANNLLNLVNYAAIDTVVINQQVAPPFAQPA